MTRSLRPRLVNGRFGDPAVFVEFAHERDALLFDLGDLRNLSGRDLLRVRTVGVSHMHIDHLIGFDSLLRVNVGREATLDLFGPEGLADRLGHKLRGYSWDLIDRYATELVFEVAELVSASTLRRWRFRLSQGFAPQAVGDASLFDGVIHRTAAWVLSARVLEHHGPCVAYALEEAQSINVWKSRVEAMWVAVGPWLKHLKHAVRQGRGDETPIAMPDGSTAPLASLRHLVSVAPGGKLGYATDIRDTPDNRSALTELCSGADILFIEAAFAAHDAERAFDRGHLTTTAGGEIARACGAARVEPFHFSPRYEDEEELRLAEVHAAFAP